MGIASAPSSSLSRRGPPRKSILCPTTSTTRRRRPSSSQLRLFRYPSRPMRRPLLRYSAQSSAWRSQTETPTKSAPASRPLRPTARRKLATFLSSPTSRISTSVARLPIKFTLFMPMKVERRLSRMVHGFLAFHGYTRSAHGIVHLDDRVRWPRYGGRPRHCEHARLRAWARDRPLRALGGRHRPALG